jgi:hypothetical protein
LVDYESARQLAQLSQEEVDAIAAHEGLPDMAALELGQYLCETADGERALKGIIRDELDACRERGDHEGAARLRLVLRHFVETHPRAKGTAA